MHAAAAPGLVALLALAAGGCTGMIDDPPARPGGGRGGADDPATATLCREGDVPDAELLRINRTTYENALRQIFGDTAVAAIEATLDALPVTRAGTYASETPPASLTEVSAYVDVSSALAWEVTKDDASLGRLSACLVGLAPADPATDPCLTDLTRQLGRRILRRPLTSEDEARFLDAYTIGGGHSVAEGVATMLITMLLDPRFLYFFEVDGTEATRNAATLSPHELAARLARVLWDSVPDDELAAAADAGLAGDLLQAQVERMWSDPRARDAVRRFYREWLELERLPYPPAAFAPDGPSRDALRAEMADELLAFTESLTFDREGTVEDLFLDRSATIESTALAQIYGAGTGDVTLPEGERAGLLTRAGFLATAEIPSSNAGHIIKRGSRLARLLCDALPPPDPNNFPPDDPADPATGPSTGIRERFLSVTSQPQCVTCHTVLDGYGAPFGHYGAAGQWIDLESIETETGSTDLPIDSTSTLSIDGESIAVAHALELSTALAGSDHAPACLAEQMTENVLGRPPRDGDGCIVESARAVLARRDADPGSLREAIFQILTSPTFSTRAIP